MRKEISVVEATLSVWYFVTLPELIHQVTTDLQWLSPMTNAPCSSSLTFELHRHGWSPLPPQCTSGAQHSCFFFRWLLPLSLLCCSSVSPSPSWHEPELFPRPLLVFTLPTNLAALSYKCTMGTGSPLPPPLLLRHQPFSPGLSYLDSTPYSPYHPTDYFPASQPGASKPDSAFKHKGPLLLFQVRLNPLHSGFSSPTPLT